MLLKDLFSSELKVINIGLPSFKETLDHVGVEAVQVDWRPPIDVSEEARRTIEAHTAEIAAANEKALDIILRGMPQLVTLDIALNVIPGMKENLFLHAGPPISWDRMCGPMRGAVMGAGVTGRVGEGDDDDDEDGCSTDVTATGRGSTSGALVTALLIAAVTRRVRRSASPPARRPPRRFQKPTPFSPRTISPEKTRRFWNRSASHEIRPTS